MAGSLSGGGGWGGKDRAIKEKITFFYFLKFFLFPTAIKLGSFP